MSAKYLMNGDRAVLLFDLDEMYLQVLNNDFLPYALKDFIQTTDASDLRKSLRDISVLKDFQSMKTEDRLKIVFACRGLSMTDNFWIKEENEGLTFAVANLRKHKLSEYSYQVAILGKYISATASELKADLSSLGMFPKYWERREDGVYLLKTGKEPLTVKAELLSSKILDHVGANHLSYRKEERDGLTFAVSKCMATDRISLVSAQSVLDWCIHTKRDFHSFFDTEDFANMCVADFCLGNPDRHFENWDFFVGNETNEIIGLAPLYDFNQALIIDWADKGNLEELIYEPTGLTFEETFRLYAEKATLDFSGITDIPLPEGARKRIERYEELRKGREEPER
jgi:hypothetical protein